MDRKRRRLVAALGAGTALSVTGCGGSGGSSAGPVNTPTPNQPGPVTPPPEEAPRVRFEHGVASGDPLADRVILWTRVTPQGEDSDIAVTVTVASDPALNSVVARYDVRASAAHDFCVKVDATGLQADRWYYYRFAVGDQLSPIGRTRTFPAAGDFIDRARFAVVSCANYPYGFFSVYRAVANHSDLDFVLHLGDYVYEYGPGEYGDFPERDPNPPYEMISLADYRARHAQYKTDEDLQAVHLQFPMIAVWDDHESADNSWRDGAANHDPLTEGDWRTRKQASEQAYFEWMPIRPRQSGDTSTIYRRFQFGDLMDLIMLDTRLEGRDEQLDLPLDPARNSEDRHLISATQMDFLLDHLSQSSSQWRFIGQQVMFAQLNIAELPSLDERSAQLRGNLSAINMDQWDGYAADRLTILNHLDDNRIDNVVILTGDIHTSWASEIYRNPSSLLGDLFEKPLAAEFVTPAVTSPGFPEGAAEVAGALIPVVNPHIRYVEAKTRGFILVDLTRERAQGEFYYAQSIESYDLRGQIDSSKTKVVTVNSGSSRIIEDRPVSRPRTLRTALLHPRINDEVVS
ncbi:twin-arginine translocation pathway signal [Alcanivorax hongdengensis A-11-3]|uniref:Twin-arginine translocation pathway signal n=1 Tax=Alcanivorax hongdengensis A-11-3 TaxID=1177179 RepID=L0WIT8_9GAMM|nr:alkaline phosphatase D family protein [Alcanivorax hongdengensis]EKF76087.1 twin-arginine translocation pathway signal [Alcanivorax hongdengensis A-11-3]